MRDHSPATTDVVLTVLVHGGHFLGPIQLRGYGRFSVGSLVEAAKARRGHIPRGVFTTGCALGSGAFRLFRGHLPLPLSELGDKLRRREVGHSR